MQSEAEFYFDCGEDVCTAKTYAGLSHSLERKLTTDDSIDGIVFMSDTLAFFRLNPPFDFTSISIQPHAGDRFKGLEKWRAGFSHLIEIRIGSIHNHTLSVLYAYDGGRVISFHKLIEATKESFRDAIMTLPINSMARREVQNSVSEKIIIRCHEDFESIRRITKQIMDYRLKNVRAYFKTSYILYKFGQSTNYMRFANEFDWLDIAALNGIVFHYAKDFLLQDHILWFIPPAIRKLTGKRSTSIYYVGIQPGVGNVRYTLPEIQNMTVVPTHVTWYTRIWPEMHRDPLGLFCRTRLSTSLKIVYEQVFTRSIEKFKPLSNLELKLRNRIPTVIRNSSNLAAEYTARVETVVFVDKQYFDATFQHTVIATVLEVEKWMSKKEYYSKELFYAQPTEQFKTKISPWFDHFAGSVKRTCDLVDAVKSVKSRMADGEIVNSKLQLFGEMCVLDAVDYLLTLCYTGNFACNMTWRKLLGIDGNFFLKDINYSWKLKTLEMGRHDGQKVINLYAPPIHFAPFYDRLFTADVPTMYEEVYAASNKLSQMFTGFAFVTVDRQLNEKLNRSLCEAFVELFLAISSQYSNIYNAKQPTMYALVRDIPCGHFKGAQVVTTYEFIQLVQGNTVRHQPYLDERFWMFRNVCTKICKEIRHPRFWCFLQEALEKKIFLSGYPLVCSKSTQYYAPTRNVVVVPSFRDLEERCRRITNFNSSWTAAALLKSGVKLPERLSICGGRGIYHCLSNVASSVRQQFDRGVFVEVVVAVIMNRSKRGDLYKCEMFSSLPPTAQNHLRFGNYINGEYVFSPEDGFQKSYKAVPPNTPESPAKEAAKSACTKYKRIRHQKTGRFVKLRKRIFNVTEIAEVYPKDSNVPIEDTCEENAFLMQLLNFKSRINVLSEDDKTEQIYELSPNTTIQSFPNLNPVTIVEISCNYGGSEWMDISFLNSCMQLLVNLSDETPVCQILKIDALMYSKLDSVNYKWSRIQERLNIVNDHTRRIFHTLFLSNHYVLLFAEIMQTHGTVIIKVKSYDTLKSMGNYTNRVRKGVQIFAEMLQSRFKDILLQKYAFAIPNIEIEMHAETPVQQDDTKNCGAASLRILEDIINEGSNSSIWQLDLEDYKWRITYLTLMHSPEGQLICNQYNHDPHKIKYYLKQIYDRTVGI
ncbi:unnamed protein product [Allacma fusca]|uniref:Ubiquitin-like protease family profile domain-containing protein n=1 Tax=Allacma fusca TaxID=39272 RepID=A0A8J2J3V3_9HEXA|nr:unnamed protein product [Allacma fusca]